MALKDKQEAFVNAYLKSFNATQAALEAGYSPKTAYSIGSENLKKPEIAARVRERLAEGAMDANEVLYHLREIALGIRADLTDSNGNIDLTLVKEANKSHLIKSIRQRTMTTEDTDIFENEIETYDRIKALELIGKHNGLFITVKVEDWRDQAIADLRDGKFTVDDLIASFGSREALIEAFGGVSLAARWLASVGVMVDDAST